MQSSTSWYLHLLPLSYIQIINPHACHTDHPAHTSHSCISPLHFSFLGFSPCSPRSHCSLTRYVLPISILIFSIFTTLYTPLTLLTNFVYLKTVMETSSIFWQLIEISKIVKLILKILPLSYIQIINPHDCHTDHPAHTTHSCISPLHFHFLGFSPCSPCSHCSPA